MNLYGHEWYTGGGPQLCGGNLAISSSSGSGELWRGAQPPWWLPKGCMLTSLTQSTVTADAGAPAGHSHQKTLFGAPSRTCLPTVLLPQWLMRGKSHTQDIWSKEECVAGELFGVNQSHDSFRNDMLSNRLCIPWHDLMTKLDQPIQRSEGVILLQFRWHFLNFTSL